MAALHLCVSMIFVAFMAKVGESRARNTVCPSICSCLGSIVQCSKKGFTSVPTDLPEWTTVLDLSSNRINNISAGSFTGLTGLREIILNNNNIEEVGRDAFSSLSNLTILKLANNRLTGIPVLTGCHDLTHLLLHHNEISEIDTEALVHLTSLQMLDLNFNSISELRSHAFPSLPHLQHLFLSNNRIETVMNAPFSNLHQLEILKMNKNRISEIPTNFSFGLSKLKHLEINRNKLTTVSGLNFQSLSSLLTLRLRRNSIATLQDGAFYGLEKTQILQLDHNNIESVTNSWLFGLDSLEQLLLSHNSINHVGTEAWKFCDRLYKLDLSHNQLESIAAGMLVGMNALQYLYLYHNQISFIQQQAFIQLSALQELNMNDNDISWTVEDDTDDSHGVFEGLSAVTRLHLDRNHLKSLPRHAFSGLGELRELHLTGNEITSVDAGSFEDLVSLQELIINSSNLLCDCELSWLPLYLLERGFRDSVVALCSHPALLAGRSIFDLQVHDFTCDDIPKPVIVQEPVSKIALKGSNATLTCQAESSNQAPMSITWKTDNNVILPAWRVQKVERVTEEGLLQVSSVLLFTAINDSDTGTYQCVVSNTLGSAYSTKAKVTVHVFPTFTKTPEDLSVKAGQSARLECDAVGQPTPQIAWQKDGGDDFPAARERRMHVIPSDSVFFIVDVKSEDKGVYSCTARNDAGIIKANATLHVFETPGFVKPMDEKKVMLGEATVLECLASGNPKPQLTWLKDGSPLELTERHYLSAVGHLLVIRHTKPSDAGIYTCLMSNSMGTEQGQSKVTVYGSSTVYAPKDLPQDDSGNTKGSKKMDHSTTTGILIIAVVCSVVGTSLIWVIIIYHTRKRGEDYTATPTDETTLPGMESGSHHTPRLSESEVLRQKYQAFSKPSDLSQHLRQAAIFPSDVEDDDVRQQIPLTQDEQQLAEASDNSLTLLRRSGAHSDSDTLPSSHTSLKSDRSNRAVAVLPTFQTAHHSLPQINSNHPSKYYYETACEDVCPPVSQRQHTPSVCQTHNAFVHCSHAVCPNREVSETGHSTCLQQWTECTECEGPQCNHQSEMASSARSPPPDASQITASAQQPHCCTICEDMLPQCRCPESHRSFNNNVSSKPLPPSFTHPSTCLSVDNPSNTCLHFNKSPLPSPTSSASQHPVSIPSPVCHAAPETVTKKTIPNRTKFVHSRPNSEDSSPFFCT